ncbi:TPA: hypothetical protein ACH3X2_001803 [Trebouxia sp. C0005]
MASTTLPLFQKADGTDDQLNLQIDEDAAFHTTLHWLRVDSHGRCTQTTEEKGSVVARLRVPFRDLRILDPLLPTPYPTAIYIRERALVVNLQSVRVIITADFAYVISVPGPGGSDHAVAPTPSSQFVKDLMHRVSQSAVSYKGESAHTHVDNNLPFELKALEAALTHAVTMMEQEAVKLYQQISPILESLAYKVAKGHLNTLRDGKASLNKQLGLVGSIKQELEDILDDDQDMEDMYLGRRRGEDAMVALEHMAYIAETYSEGTQTDNEEGSVNEDGVSSPAGPATHSWNLSGGHEQQTDGSQTAYQEPQHLHTQMQSQGPQQTGPPPLIKPSRADSTQVPAAPVDMSNDMRLAPTVLYEKASRAIRQRHPSESTDPLQYRSDFHQAPALLGKLKRMGGGATRKRSSAYVDPRDIEGCEALLEAHFTQADYTLRRLQQLKERILGTESLVAIELDSRRNELVALNLVVVIITVMFAFVAMVAGIFGQNLHFSSTTTGTGIFLAVTISSLVGGGVLCFGLLAYARYKRLLMIPSGPEGPSVS